MDTYKNSAIKNLLYALVILCMAVLMVAKCSRGENDIAADGLASRGVETGEGGGGGQGDALQTMDLQGMHHPDNSESPDAEHGHDSDTDAADNEPITETDGDSLSDPQRDPSAEADSETEDIVASPMPWELFYPHSLEDTDPLGESINYRYDIQVGGEIIDEFLNPEDIFFGMPEAYSDVKGITTFRSNNFRNSAAYGYAEVEEERLREVYRINIGSHQRWTGVGWSGQPAIVQWDHDVRQQMNIHPHKKEKDDLIEVIQGAVDGNVYFFDLMDGEQTRPPIRYGEVIKGGVSVDPRGYPILYIGQGDQFYYRTGYAIFSLLDCKEQYFMTGHDSFAPRYWGLFDSNPLFDIPNDRMFLCGENGVIYNIKLNTDYDQELGSLSIEPEISRYRYTSRINAARSLGMESSPAIFMHYLYIADNGGLVQCVDLMTFRPIWARDCTDDTDATLVLDWEEEQQMMALYTGSQTDYQGSAYLRKLNAENGELIWEYTYPCLTDTAVSGGLLATPVAGRNDIADLVIFWVGKVTGRGGYGALVAFDKGSGEVVWENILPSYGWSSPACIYTEDGRSYLIVCDAIGRMYLIRGTTGEVLDSISLGNNVEASPAVYGNMIVVGTRGQQIYGIRIS